MEIPTGYFIDTEELFRIQSEGYNAWSVDEKVVIFFHRVRKIIAIFSLYLYFVKCYSTKSEFMYFLQLTPDYECVNFTLRSAFPVSRLSTYIPVEIRDWYAPGK